MTDIMNSVNNSLSITKKLFEKIENVDTKWELATLYNELTTARIALIVRKRIERKLNDFDFQKDTKLVDAFFE
jgi:ribosomal protein L14E/L6E/L27E